MQREVLWQWPALCAAVGLSPAAGPPITGIAIDSRRVVAGDLFIALEGDPGPRFHTHATAPRDGHDFVADAVRRGAAGVLVHRAPGIEIATLQVPDTLDALWALGRAGRARLQGAVVAITGSSGKTTARTWLMAALDCPGSEGSFNNFWGVPLSLARTPAAAPEAVFEVGTNHPGEIAPLARMVAPTVAAVLNVGQAHLENFADADALRREKLSIANGLTRDGTLVVPDDLDLSGVAAAPRILTFGRSARASVRLVEYRSTDRVGRYVTPAGEMSAAVPGGGLHRALTLAAVLAILVALGRPPQVAARLSDATIPAGRGRREQLGDVTLIDDSYNANPASMTAALALLAEAPTPRYAVLGEMLELGRDSAHYHRALASACAGVDGVVCVGEGMRALYDALPAGQRLAFADRAEDLDLAALRQRLRGPCTVLIKGSNRVFWAVAFAARLRAAWC